MLNRETGLMIPIMRVDAAQIDGLCIAASRVDAAGRPETRARCKVPDIFLPNVRIPELNGTGNRRNGGSPSSRGIRATVCARELGAAPSCVSTQEPRCRASDERLDLAAWHREWMDSAHSMPSPDKPLPVPPNEVAEDTELEEDYQSDLTALRDVFVVLRAVWSSEPADVPLMSCVDTLESDSGLGGDGVKWQTDSANLRSAAGRWMCGSAAGHVGRDGSLQVSSSAEASTGPRAAEPRGTSAAAGDRAALESRAAASSRSTSHDCAGRRRQNPCGARPRTLLH